MVFKVYRRTTNSFFNSSEFPLCMGVIVSEVRLGSDESSFADCARRCLSSGGGIETWDLHESADDCAELNYYFKRKHLGMRLC